MTTLSVVPVSTNGAACSKPSRARTAGHQMRALLEAHTTPPSNNPISVLLGATYPPILVWMTAVLAARLLACIHPRNRDSNNARIVKLAQSILNNKWVLSHQGGAVDMNGRVLDFVHRLKAVVLADKTKLGLAVPMWVFPDCDAKVFAVIDRGLARNPTAIFVQNGGGRSHAPQVVAIGRATHRGASIGNYHVNLDEAVRTTIVHEALIRDVLKECNFGRRSECPFYSAGWAGAFARAAISLGKNGMNKIRPLIRRYVGQQSANGRVLAIDDPMRTFHELLRLTHEADKGPGQISRMRDWTQYPYAVVAIQHALAGKALSLRQLKFAVKKSVTDFVI